MWHFISLLCYNVMPQDMQAVINFRLAEGGATDARHYEEICDTGLRCCLFLTTPEDLAAGIHGTNERLPIRSYIQGIRILIHLMEQANLHP